MRIGIDNISPGESTGRQAPGGMRMYLQSLLAEFAAQAPKHQFVLFTPTWADSLLEKTPSNVEILSLPSVPVRRPMRIVYQQTVFAAEIARQRLDVFFATATVTPLLISAPIVLAVQFLQFYEMPQDYGHLRSAYLRLMLPLSLNKAARAIIFTESAKRDLVRFTGVSESKVRVVPHGLPSGVWSVVDTRAESTQDHLGLKLTGGRPYIVYVSATYGYKNHLRLIRAFALLKRRTRLPHALLLVGSEIGVSFAALRSEAERAGIKEDVIIAGRLDQAISVYLDAALTAIPTLYETFGFPVLEAMACGCPIVTSNLGSMAELADGAAVLVDPFDEQALAEGMEQVLTDVGLREQLVIRGRQRAAGYTWSRTAAQTLAILEEVAGL